MGGGHFGRCAANIGNEGQSGKKVCLQFIPKSSHLQSFFLLLLACYNGMDCRWSCSMMTYIRKVWLMQVCVGHPDLGYSHTILFLLILNSPRSLAHRQERPSFIIKGDLHSLEAVLWLPLTLIRGCSVTPTVHSAISLFINHYSLSLFYILNSIIHSIIIHY